MQHIGFWENKFQLRIGVEELRKFDVIVLLAQCMKYLYRSASPSITPPTQSEAALEIMVAHFWSIGRPSATPNGRESRRLAKFKKYDKGIEKTCGTDFRSRLPLATPGRHCGCNVQPVGHRNNCIESDGICRRVIPKVRSRITDLTRKSSRGTEKPVYSSESLSLSQLT